MKVRFDNDSNFHSRCNFFCKFYDKMKFSNSCFRNTAVIFHIVSLFQNLRIIWTNKDLIINCFERLSIRLLVVYFRIWIQNDLFSGKYFSYSIRYPCNVKTDNKLRYFHRTRFDSILWLTFYKSHEAIMSKRHMKTKVLLCWNAIQSSSS